jgi:hypothetical protein
MPPGFEPMTRRERRLAAVLSAVLLGAVVAPVRQNWNARPRDGFPLSYYPMFSKHRSRKTTVYCLVGETATGERVRIGHRLVGDGGGNQTRKQINRMVREGRGEELCRGVAGRLAALRPEIVAVHLVHGRYHLDRTFRAGKLTGKETILCTVRCDPAESHQAG